MDWSFNGLTAVARTDPALIPEEAWARLRGYAAAMAARFIEEDTPDGIRRLRATRVIDGVTVTILAPVPLAITPLVESQPPGEQPIEHQARLVISDTRAWAPVAGEGEPQEEEPDESADAASDEEDDVWPALHTSPIPALTVPEPLIKVASEVGGGRDG